MFNKSILNNLKSGWCDFELGDFKGKVSYIRNVPIDIINGYMEYIKTGHCVIEFDEEGSYFSLVICNDQEVYIIAHRDKLEYHKIDFNAADIIVELFNEIKEKIDVWINWLDYAFEEEDNFRYELKNKIYNIEKELINDKI